MAAATVQCNICRTNFFASTIEEVMDDLNRHREERHGISREEVEAASEEETFVERMRRDRGRREYERMNWTEYDYEFLKGMRISAN